MSLFSSMSLFASGFFAWAAGFDAFFCAGFEGFAAVLGAGFFCVWADLETFDAEDFESDDFACAGFTGAFFWLDFAGDFFAGV